MNVRNQDMGIEGFLPFIGMKDAGINLFIVFLHSFLTLPYKISWKISLKLEELIKILN